MTRYLEAVSSTWDQPSVDGANTLFNKPEYTADNWRVFFEGYFAAHRMTEPLWNYLGYPVLGWFSEEVHIKLQSALDAVARRQIRGILDVHSSALGTYLSSNKADRDDLRFWLIALWNLAQNGVSSFDRGALYGWTRQLVDSFPALLLSDHAIDPVQNLYVNWVRMQVQYILCNSIPLTDAVKAQIAATIRISGPERNLLWTTHTVLLHDNLFFSTDDVTFFQAYFDAIPPGLATPVGISVNDALGNSGATGLWVAAKGGFNVFQWHVRSCQTGRFEFPADVPEFDTDCQAIVTAHEANHVVNHLGIEPDPTLGTRQKLLIQQAGSDPQNYLRSMIDAGVFVGAPQEFFASIANMYMTNTALTLEVGRLRLLAGRQCPLEQFLFFVDVYSGGSDVSRGYLTGTDARVHWYEIPLVRDGQGRIKNLAFLTKSYSVDYDAENRAVTLAEEPVPSASYVFVPIVLSSSGLGGAFFTSELGLTNRGSTDASISYTYTAAFGGSSGTATDSLQAGRQRIIPDAITFLKGLGIPLGDSGNRGGTLRITFTGLSSADAGAATVRTTTSVAEGRAGLAYAGLPSSRLLSAPVYLCGLRQNATDRSNVAVMNAGGSADGDVTLRLTVVSGDPANPMTQALPDIPLSPGGFNQISGILASNGLTLTNGYVKVERISGTAPFYAYGVVNDQANSDGSFVEPVAASPATAVTGATLPVVVETSTFSTEAVLTNLTSSARTVRCTYVASALPGGSVSFDIALLPNEQQILPDFVQVLRDRGVVPGARGPTFAGALFATDATGDLRGISIGARTSAAGGGGRYGLFYSALAHGAEATTSAWLYGQQNADNRTNVALVNVGSTDSSTDVFRIDLYDGATGQKSATVDNLSVPAKGFLQVNTILAQYAPGVTTGYALVTRTSGSNPFIAYAVVNDGGQPGQRSGDGAFVAASLPVGP